MTKENCAINPALPLNELPRLGRFNNGFMGINAEGDDGNYTGRDRVYPVHAETAVLAAYNQQAVINRLCEKSPSKLNYLEVGCGAGFTGIAASKYLQRNTPELQTNIYMCDINPRAVKATEENARKNAAQVTVLPAQNFSAGMTLEDGKVIEPQSIDVMYLHPPYMQKFPLLEPHMPIYGAAGNDDGLDIFRNWMPHIQTLLAPEGVVLGTVISPMNDDRKIPALELIKKQLGDSSAVEYFEILPPISSKEFMTKQYKEIIDRANKDGNEVLANNITEWIDENSKKHPKFVYVYFEATQRGLHSGINSMTRPHWKNHGLNSMEDLLGPSKTLMNAYEAVVQSITPQARIKEIKDGGVPGNL